MLIWKMFSARFRCEPDQNHPDKIDERDRGTGAGITVAKVSHHTSHLPGAGGRKDPPEIKRQSLPGRAHPRREELGQILRQPAVKRSGTHPGEPDRHEKAEGIGIKHRKKKFAHDERTEAKTEIDRATTKAQSQQWCPKTADDRAERLRKLRVCLGARLEATGQFVRP